MLIPVTVGEILIMGLLIAVIVMLAVHMARKN
jgi:hypothetical protein